MSGEQCWEDCCDYCRRVDGSPDEDPCPRMIKRCAGDSCNQCKPCPHFDAGSAFREASQLLRRRPPVKLPATVQANGKGHGRRLMGYDRPAGKVGP